MKTLRKYLAFSSVFAIFLAIIYFFPLYCRVVTINLLYLYNALRSFKERRNNEFQGYLGDILITLSKLCITGLCLFVTSSYAGLFPFALLYPSPLSSHFLQPNLCLSLKSQVRVTSSGAGPLDKVRFPLTQHSLFITYIQVVLTYLFE